MYISHDELAKLGASDDEFYCSACLKSVFPFNHLSDNSEFLNAVNNNDFRAMSESLLFQPIFNGENRFLANDDNLDPDSNFFNDFSLPACKYVTATGLNGIINMQLPKSNFSLMHVNCRGLRTNFVNLVSLIESFSFKIPVIAVSETRTTDDIQNNFNIYGYNFVVKSRHHKSGGGVGLYISNDVSYKLRKDLELDIADVYESVIVELTAYNLIVGCIYHPPNSDLVSFTSAFDTLMSKINNEKRLSYIAGDFNVNILKHDCHEPTSNFINCAFSHSFFPIINRPTRITPTTATLIDNIFTNAITSHSYTPSILYSDISDHLPIFVTINSLTIKPTPSSVSHKRFFSSNNKSKFLEQLAAIDWNQYVNVTDNNNVDSLYCTFADKFQSVYEACFPLTKINTKCKQKPRKPWMTAGLANSCRKKERLYKIFIKNPNDANRSNYTKYRNKLIKLLHKAENMYYINKFEALKTDMKQTWKTIKDILNTNQMSPLIDTFNIGNKPVKDKAIIAQKFNEYFINIGPSLAAKIPLSPTSYSSYLKGNYKNSFAILDASAEEIITLVKQMPSKHSSGHDNIPLDIMKLCINLIAEPLSKLINISFANGYFPDVLKIARVCPVFKCGDKSEFTNYRPISILPSFSKVFEKLMYTRLTNYLTKHSVLYKNQFGFRSNHSTLMAIIEMVDKITDAIDKKEYSVGVFVDLSKAFDTLDHNILLYKLQHYGVRGVALEWFKSYLDKRTQFVDYNGTNSSYLKIKCGVPQGSILGPLLFLLYMNDIASVSKILNLILFADDTNIFLSNRNLTTLIQNLNCELQLLNKWFLANKLSLNISKTNFIIFTSKQRKADLENQIVTFNCLPIAQVKHTKFLGVYIEEHLNWEHHIKQVESKISKSIGVLSKLKHYLPRHLLLTIYNSLVTPYLNYCPMIWASEINCTKLNKINILQKKAIRIICNLNFTAHAAPSFKKLNLLLIADIAKLQLGEFMYKFSYKLLPDVFSNYFTLNSNIHKYNTRQAKNLHQLPINTSLRKFSINVSGPKLWNILPKEIKSISSLSKFKYAFTTILLKNYT